MPRGMKRMGGRIAGAMADPRSRFFMALSCDQRLKLIELMKEGEKTLSELTETLGVDVSVVSRHLMMLRDLGIVSARREGVYLYFSIADTRIFDIITLSSQIISDWYSHHQKFFR